MSRKGLTANSQAPQRDPIVLSTSSTCPPSPTIAEEVGATSHVCVWPLRSLTRRVFTVFFGVQYLRHLFDRLRPGM